MINKLIQFYTFLLLFIFCGLAVNAQTFDFKKYDSSVGLPQNYIYSIVQDLNGYLWIGTGQGLVKFDGFKFEVFTVNDSLASDGVEKLYLAKSGLLWVGHNNGDLSYFDGIKFNKISVESTTSPIHDICEDSNGVIWAVDQNRGLIRVSTNYEVRTFYDRKKFGRNNYYSLASISPTEFLIGTDDGLLKAVFSKDLNDVNVEQVKGVPQTQIECIVPREKEKGQYWIGTQDEGFYKYSHNFKTSEHIIDNRLCLLFDIQKETIKDVYEDKDQNVLVATWGHGVIKLLWDPVKEEFSDSFNFSTLNGLNVDYVKEFLCDRENNYWFATYGGGVASLIRDYFVFYNLEEIGFKDQKVVSALRTKDALWMGLEKGLMKADPLCFTDFEFYDAALGVPNDRITGIYEDGGGVVWIASQNNGLFFRNKGELKFKPYHYSNSTPGKMINDVLGYENKLYLATNEGLYVLNTFKKTQEYYDMSKGLSHNTINFIYRDQKGVIWLGPKNNGICSLSNNTIERHKLLEGSVNIADMTEDRDGNKWLATENMGLLKYAGDSLVNFTIDEGLKKNYCYSITCDRMNRLWVCHHPGLTSIDLNTGQTRIFDYDNNMNGEFNQVIKDEDGDLWFSSSEGIINYLPQSDQKNFVAPLLNLSSIIINDKPFPLNEEIVLPYPYGKKKYNLRFEFRGISFEDPEKVRYETQLVKGDGETLGEDSHWFSDHGNESEWESIGSTNFVKFEYLLDGDYTLKVRAFNADGVVSIIPISRRIVIEKPFWKTIWFISVVLLLMVGGIYLLITYRERKLIQQKIVLQREVASQTVVLRNQKAEIERKNRDITDSINYAKKIQSSILPMIDDLTTLFPDSFIYFVPRDIVSGDFYWFNRTKDYFVLCCADCTGHGVPGAFMSMIGTTILNDIFKLPEISSPATMLERLDREIKLLLQSNQGAESKDGMDISVLEIHIPTRTIRLASARRPVYLMINDELTIYKGNRRSIGDDAISSNVEFVNMEYKCAKGDQIFMFSDGYSDQFGGPNGKKLMTVGVRDLVEEIYGKSKEEQIKIVKDTFENWKGDYEQVDDVLFMGIKL